MVRGKAGVRRIVYAGSSSAYGDQPKPAKHEGLLPMPLSPYAAAKVAGEYLLPGVYVDVRFGNRDDPLFQRVRAAAGPQEPVRGGDSEVHHGDAGRRDGPLFLGMASNRAILRTSIISFTATCWRPRLRTAVGKTINVACGESFDLLQLVDGINKALGRM